MTTARVPASSAVRLIQEVYRIGPVGHCLHIVLDDGNVSNGDVQWCLDKPDICDVCRACAVVLRSMTVTARRKAIRLAKNTQLDYEHEQELNEVLAKL